MEDYGKNDGKIDHEAVIEKEFIDDIRQRKEAEDTGAVELAGSGNADLAYASGKLIERAAEEVCNAACKDCERKARNILVCAKGYRQEAEEEAAERSGCECADERKHDEQYGGRSDPCLCACALIEEGAYKACNAAEIHYTRYAEIKAAGFLCQYFADRAKHDNRTEYDSSLEQ